MRFPSQCSKCLGTRDLTSYIAKWENKYYAGYKMGTTKYITEKASTNVPICNSCLKSLESGIRIPYKKRFVITGLIWLGILLLTIIFKAPIVSAIALSLGFGIVPAIFLYYFIRPGGRIKWPVRFQSQNIFSFENETYAKRFASVNGPNAEVY